MITEKEIAELRALGEDANEDGCVRVRKNVVLQITDTLEAALRVVRAAQVCTSPCGDWQEQQKRDIEIIEALKPFQQSGSVAASEG